MLVIKLKAGGRVLLSGGVVVELLGTGSDRTARLAVTAAPEVTVLREELLSPEERREFDETGRLPPKR